MQWMTGDPVSFQAWLNKDNKTESVPASLIYFYSVPGVVPLLRGVQTLNTFQYSKNILFRQGKRKNTCTLMFLANLAYPKWITIDCNTRHYIDVVCMKIVIATVNNSVSYSPNKNKCSKQGVIKDIYCFYFIYFNGKKDRLSTKESYSSLNSMKEFYFIILAVKYFPKLLSPGRNKMKILYYIRYFNTIKMYIKYETTKDSVGYLVTKAIAIQNINATVFGNVYLCTNGQSISSLYLCDGIFDCGSSDKSDEEGCTCANQRFAQSLKCKYISRKGKPLQCSFLYSSYENHENCSSFVDYGTLFMENAETNICCHQKPTNTHFRDDCVDSKNDTVSEIFLSKSVRYPCSEIPCRYRSSDNNCFSILDICVYRLSKHYQLVPCASGEHIQQCETFQCNKHFKCPGYYCIPFAYICDGKWDCPKGCDENLDICSNKRLCINLFHCKNSQICIHIDDVCDTKIDCPFLDDEQLCTLLSVTCPIICMCHGLAVQCLDTDIIFSMLSSNLPYISVFISLTNVYSLQIVRKFISISYLFLSHNKIRKVCYILHRNDTIIHLDINSNAILQLYRNCFINLLRLEIINLSNNSIQRIHEFAFVYLPKLKMLNLAKNNLNEIHSNVLQNISFLYIRNNPLLLLKRKVFHNSRIIHISSNAYHVCCLTPPSISCNAVKPWYISCLNLLPNTSTRVLLTVVSFSIFLLNILSISLQVKGKGFLSFKFLIIFVNISDLVCSVYLIILLFADFLYHDNFITNEVLWRSSTSCSMIFIFSLSFSLLSPIYLVFMSLCRCFAVALPLNLKMKDNYFIGRVLVSIFLSLILFSTSVGLVYKSKNNSYPSVLCLPFIDPLKSNIFLKIMTISTGFCQVTASIFICLIYIVLITKIKQSDYRVQKSKATSRSYLTLQLLIVTASNLLCWIPSNADLSVISISV